MLVDVGGGGELARLEGDVHRANILPIGVERRDRGRVEASVELRTLEVGDNGAKRRLRGQARHRVDRDVDDIRTRLSGRKHRRDARTGRVVRVNVDGHIRVLLAEGGDEHLGGARRE